MYRSNIHIEKVICLNILFHQQKNEKHGGRGKILGKQIRKMKLNRHRKRIERGEGREGNTKYSHIDS